MLHRKILKMWCSGLAEITFQDIGKVCSVNFEPPDIDLCSACHVRPLLRGAWIVSILFILNKLTWGLDSII